MLIARCVSCDEKDKTVIVKRKEEMSELESARLSHSVAGKQPVRPQDNLLAQRNSTLSSADSRSVRDVPLAPWTNVSVLVVASVFGLIVPRRTKHSNVAWIASTDPTNNRDVSAMSTTEYA